jgi:RNA polymerase sigma factor (sigma-70 family)
MSVAAAKPPVRRARNGASRRRDLTPAERDERASLVAECSPAAYRFAHRTLARFPWLDRDDVIGEAMLILSKAAEFFQPERGLKFVTMVYAVVPRHLWRYATGETRRMGAEGRHFSEFVGEGDDPDPFEDAIADTRGEPASHAADVAELLAAARKRSLPHEWDLLWRRYVKGETLRATAARLGVSREQVRQLSLRALGRIRAAMTPP